MVCRQRLTDDELVQSPAAPRVPYYNRLFFFHPRRAAHHFLFNLAIVLLCCCSGIENRAIPFLRTVLSRARPQLKRIFLSPMVMENVPLPRANGKSSLMPRFNLPCFQNSQIEQSGRR